MEIDKPLLTIRDIKALYQEHFSQKKARTIGPEEEYPLINKETYEAVTNNEIEKFFLSLENNGWKAKRTKEQGNIEEVKKYINDQEVIISTDFGSCTIEVNYPPSKTLQDIEKIKKKTITELTEAAKKSNNLLLGYAIQPISLPQKRLVAQKERYKTLEERFWTTEALAHLVTRNKGITDVHYHTINSASQVHLSVHSEEEAIRALTLFNKILPIMLAYTANSPIWQGKENSMVAAREKFWDWVVAIPQDQHRKGILPYEIPSLDDYIHLLLSFEPVLSKRGEKYYELIGRATFQEYLKKQSIEGVSPGSIDRKYYDITKIMKRKGKNQEKYRLQPRVIDYLAHESFIWYAARLKAAYGTLEIRINGQQPPGEDMIIAALSLGILENLDKTEAFFSQLSLEDARKAREEAIRYGIYGKIKGISFMNLGNDLYQLAYEGLKKRDNNETGYLEIFKKRIMDKTNPGEEIKKIYKEKGIEEVIAKISY